MDNIFEQIYQIGIIPVIKINDVTVSENLGEALLRGGLPAAEVTFRSDAAPEAIHAMSQKVPDLLLCAGTILNVENAKCAVEAGAKVIISPGINLEVIRWCRGKGIPVIPGCATPSEVEACMREGLKIVKLFPAEVLGGIKMLKALQGPYGTMKFMPTGGITPTTVFDYLIQPNVVACGGSWLTPEKLLNSDQFDKIEMLAREAAQIVLQAKKGK